MPNLLERMRQLVADDTGEQRADRQPLAIAVLLVEVLRADHVQGDAERDAVLKLLRECSGLGAGEASALLAEAERTANEDVSLHRHVETLNQTLDHEARRRILLALWQVAYADGELHPWEEHLLRRLADLLHLSHSDFIQTKLQVAS